MPVFRIGHFPSESDSETMLKVLKWGVVPLNLKGHDMTPHSLCWVSTNARLNIHRFNHNYLSFKSREVSKKHWIQ